MCGPSWFPSSAPCPCQPAHFSCVREKDRFQWVEASELRIKTERKNFSMANFKLSLLLSFDFNWNFPSPGPLEGLCVRRKKDFPFFCQTLFCVHCFSWKFQVFKLLVYVWRAVGRWKEVFLFVSFASKLSKPPPPWKLRRCFGPLHSHPRQLFSAHFVCRKILYMLRELSSTIIK